MGYQALLFCPDEKTARTVTQVLTELEFSVEACTEPFAAVKKLMGQHFDAVVVDCDNEQNATLLFKSARNSSSNQTSLAVAVVEGQAGVAKAFRIGANLVLTKPINLEQAKGTIRVARGLLRKSEPAKPAASASAPAAPVKPAAPKPTLVAKPVAPAQVATPKPAPISGPISAPAPVAPPAWPVAPAASSVPVAKDIEPLDIHLESPAVPVTAAPAPKLPEISVASKPSFAVATSGAASAPAPALEPTATEKSLETGPAETPVANAIDATHEEPSGVIGASPSFTFGGDSEAEAGGGKKKIVLGIVAAAILAVAYIGWTQFQGHSSQPTPVPVASPTPVSKPQAQKPAATQPSSIPATPAPVSSAPVSTTGTPADFAAENIDSSSKDKTTHSTASKPSTATSATSPKPTENESPDAAPLLVKSGKVSASQNKTAAVDAPAPSLIGMAASGAGAPPPSLVSTTGNAFKPVLQTVNISQGVSQGLLVKKISPSYPANALRLHIEGPVDLIATISPQGNISHIKVLSGDAQLTKAATDAVKQWKYKPYLLNGEPVEIQTQITINFKLPR